jgi:hypothetical protein
LNNTDQAAPEQRGVKAPVSAFVSNEHRARFAATTPLDGHPANHLIRDHRHREIPAKHVENGGHRELHFCAPMFKAPIVHLQVLRSAPRMIDQNHTRA